MPYTGAAVLLFLILLLLALAALAVFAAQNGGTESVSFLTFSWSGVPVWLPPATAGGAVAALLLLHMLYTGLRHGWRRRGLQRQLGSQQGTIEELRAENEQLKAKLERLEAELGSRPGGEMGPAPGAAER